MGALDQLKQNDEQQEAMETLEALTSTVLAVEQQLTKLTKTVADLTGFVKVMDEQQDRRLTRLTSQQREPVSTLPDDETKKRLSEIENTLASVSETLSMSKAVKLPSGESVTQSDLASYSMMRKIEKQTSMMVVASDRLADAVNKRGRVVINTDKLTEHAVKQLHIRLAKVVDARVDEIEQRVASIGAKQSADASQRVEQVAAKAEAVVHAVGRAERRLDNFAARVTWVTAGRFALAVLPISAVLLIVGGLTMGVFHALGVGPLLGWAWASFSAAEVWWVKALIALSAVSGAVVFAWVVWRGAKRLGNEYARW